VGVVARAYSCNPTYFLYAVLDGRQSSFAYALSGLYVRDVGFAIGICMVVVESSNVRRVFTLRAAPNNSFNPTAGVGLVINKQPGPAAG
jgi:hypothetical protein